MPDLQKTQQLYKKKYKQLIDGVSLFFDDNTPIYIKHLSELDIGELELATDKYHKEAKKKGLPAEKDKISILIKQELWADDKEKEISTLRKQAALLQDTHKKLFLKKQIKNSQVKIDSVLKDLTSLLSEREEILGLTCEKYAEKKSNEEIVVHCFFKDREMSQKFFSEEEFDELNREKLYYYIKIYNDISREFSTEEMKRLAALPFFINLFFLCDDNIYTFYGKSITELTLCQIDAFNCAKTYKSIMSQGNSPSDEMYEDLDQLVAFYESYSSGGSGGLKEAKHKASQSIIGASIEEMKQLTKGDDGVQVVTLDKIEEGLKKEGRTLSDLSLQEIAEMHQ